VTHSESYLCRQHKAKNGWKPTSETSKIHFWGRKIKFSFWLNKCFWNILQLIKHIQEGYFSNFWPTQNELTQFTLRVSSWWK
jgi:hypothetical protein